VEGRVGLCLVVTDLTEQKQAISREKELQIRLMEQREEERVRIARNLHDGPLQDLIALSFSVQAMSTNNQAGGMDLADMRESILKLAGELRTVCNELRPPSTIRFGLAKAIQYQSEEFRSKYPQLAIHLDLVKDEQTIPKEISAVLFRIYQECMNNVIRHAHATEIKIRLRTDQHTVLLEVEDNGAGFQPPDDWVELARQGHLGLVGMRERAEAVGGKIEVVSGSPKCKGTTIQVEVPCEMRES
jgi:signal transduction histidine kinase